MEERGHEDNGYKVKIAVLEEKIAASDELNHNTSLRMEEVKDIQSKYLLKETYELNHNILMAKIEALQKFMWIAIGGLIVLNAAVGFILLLLPVLKGH